MKINLSFLFLCLIFCSIQAEELKTNVDVDVLEKALNDIVKKYNLDVAGNKSDEELKKQDALIRQKQEELKKAVEEHNKKIKEDFENKKKEVLKEGEGNFLKIPEIEKNDIHKTIEDAKNLSHLPDKTSIASIGSKEDEKENSSHNFLKEIESINVKLNHLIERVNTLQKDMDCLKVPQKTSTLVKKGEAIAPEIKAEFDIALKVFEEDPVKSIENFEIFGRNHKGHPMVVDAHLKIAEAYIKVAKWDLANITLQNILLNDKISIQQNVEALLLLGDSQRNQNDRTSACKTLFDLERSNLPMTAGQNIRYQSLIVSSDCASKLDKDVRDND